MREACREERLFLAIGGVADALVEEAGAEAPRRQSPLMRWTAIAAAAAVVAAAGLGVLPRMGGAAGDTGIIENNSPAGGMAFLSYAGPVLPLTVLDGPEGLPAAREVSWDFSGATEGQGSALYQVTVTDDTIIRNDSEGAVTLTVGYPAAASLQDGEKTLPVLTVDGAQTETAMLWGDTGAGGVWESAQLSSWEDYQELLGDGRYLSEAREEPPALEQQVTVWEIVDSTAPAVDHARMAPTLAIRFQVDEARTQVFTYGFNGASFEEDGSRQYDYFVPRQGDRDSRRLLIFLGEVPEEYTIEGYENGACETPLEGVTGRMTAFTTTLRALMDQLAEEELARMGEELLTRLEAVKGATRRLMGRLLTMEEKDYSSYYLEDVLSYVYAGQRVAWCTAEVTVPAGGEVRVTARCQKAPSYDFACAGQGELGRFGFDMAAGLGSSLRFTSVTARLENAEGVELEEQSFGFDLAKGITRVALPLEEEYFYMVVKRKG